MRQRWVLVCVVLLAMGCGKSTNVDAESVDAAASLTLADATRQGRGDGGSVDAGGPADDSGTSGAGDVDTGGDARRSEPDMSADDVESPVEPDTSGPSDASEDAVGTGDVVDARGGSEDVDEDGPYLPVPEGPLGGDRPAPVFLPTDYDPAENWPLVVLLHGFGETGSFQDGYYNLSDHIDDFGFILVRPDGKKNGFGQQYWDAVIGMCNYTGTPVDDRAYILGLIEEAKTKFHVDASRVVLFGHSCGGYLAHRMACDHADVVSGVVSHAGGCFGSMAFCNPTEPVSILNAHGTYDTVVNYYAPAVGSSAEALAWWWADHGGCDAEVEEKDLRNYDNWVWGSETRPLEWDGCDAGTTVWVWRMNGSGHFPALTDTFTSDALTLMFNHPKVD